MRVKAFDEIRLTICHYDDGQASVSVDRLTTGHPAREVMFERLHGGLPDEVLDDAQAKAAWMMKSITNRYRKSRQLLF